MHLSNYLHVTPDIWIFLHHKNPLSYMNITIELLLYQLLSVTHCCSICYHRTYALSFFTMQRPGPSGSRMGRMGNKKVIHLILSSVKKS